LLSASDDQTCFDLIDLSKVRQTFQPKRGRACTHLTTNDDYPLSHTDRLRHDAERVPSKHRIFNGCRSTDPRKGSQECWVMEMCCKGHRKHPECVYRVTDRCATAGESIWFFHLVADFLARTYRQEKVYSRHESVQKVFNPSRFRTKWFAPEPRPLTAFALWSMSGSTFSSQVKRARVLFII